LSDQKKKVRGKRIRESCLFVLVYTSIREHNNTSGGFWGGGRYVSSYIERVKTRKRGQGIRLL